MKNTIKRTAAVLLAAAVIGVGAFAPVTDNVDIFSQTSITAEAASVGKPTGLKSKTLSNSEIKLTWKKVKNVSGYTVYMRDNGKYKKVADCKGTSYTVKKLPNASRKYFKVRAYKTVKGKKVYGAYSASWNTATNPQAAKGLKVSGTTDSTVTLKWSKIGCTNYRVFQMINGSWKQIATTNSTSYTVGGLSEGTSYQFRIRACKQDYRKVNHYGKYSAAVTATTAAAEPKFELTQSDVDRLCKELNAYSRTQSWDYISSIYEECGYSSVEECYETMEKNSNLEDNSWGTPDTVSPDTYSSYDELYRKVKGHIDDLYRVIGKNFSHITLYQEWHGDGSAINSDGKPAWEIYLLY